MYTNFLLPTHKIDKSVVRIYFICKLQTPIGVTLLWVVLHHIMPRFALVHEYLYRGCVYDV